MSDANCPICLFCESNVITECGHRFCSSCIEKWCCSKISNCPVCRKNIFSLKSHRKNHWFLNPFEEYGFVIGASPSGDLFIDYTIKGSQADRSRIEGSVIVSVDEFEVWDTDLQSLVEYVKYKRLRKRMCVMCIV